MFYQLLFRTFGFRDDTHPAFPFSKKTLNAMPAKNEQLSAAQLSEISTIRNILMGQQMSEYENKFSEFGEEISGVKEHFNHELSSFNQKSDERIRQLEQAMNERFNRIEKMLADQVSRLDEKLLTISRSDKNDLGKMLSELSKKLMGE